MVSMTRVVSLPTSTLPFRAHIAGMLWNPSLDHEPRMAEGLERERAHMHADILNISDTKHMRHTHTHTF